MLSPRILSFSVLSVVLLAAFLYSAILPQGPQLFGYLVNGARQSSALAEMTTRAEKFTPESAFLSMLPSDRTYKIRTDNIQGATFSASKIGCSS